MNIVEYLLALEDGERVIETSRNCFYGRCGTVYHNKDGSPCVLWDKKQNEEGHMGTGVGEGIRRIKEVLANFDLTLPAQ